MEPKSTKLERAKKRVKDIKDWYNHLLIYIIINTLLQLFYSGVFDDGAVSMYVPTYARFITPIFWGLGVIGHGLYVHRGQFFKNLFKNWEERKIKEIMEEEDEVYQSKWK